MTVVFVLGSVLAATSSISRTARSSKAETNPQLFIELFAVAVCFMGGLSLFGGRGSVFGIVLGAALRQLVQDVIILMRLPGVLPRYVRRHDDRLRLYAEHGRAESILTPGRRLT